jgi:WD40 repeat protein
LISGEEEGAIQISDCFGKRIKKFDIGMKGQEALLAMAFISPDMLAIACGKTIKLWDILTGDCKQVIPVSSTVVTNSFVVCENKILAVGCQDNTLQVFDSSTGSLLRKMSSVGPPTSLTRFFIGGAEAVAAIIDEKKIQVWRLSEAKPPPIIECQDVRVCCLTTVSGLLAAGLSDGSVRIWNSSLSSYDSFRAHSIGSIVSITSLPGGLLATASSMGNIKIWDPIQMKCLFTERAYSLEFASTPLKAVGEFLAWGNTFGEIKLLSYRNQLT